jgi:uncharacterized membrane protein YvbJ
MTIYCQECGEDNQDGSHYCKECGADLTRKIVKIEDSSEVSESKKYVIAALCLILACLLIYILAFMVFNKNF